MTYLGWWLRADALILLWGSGAGIFRVAIPRPYTPTLYAPLLLLR